MSTTAAPAVLDNPKNTFEHRVAQYVKLRDIKKAKEKAHKAEMERYDTALSLLNKTLLDMLRATKQDSANVRGIGTVYKTTKKSATIADKDAFKRHVIGAEDYDLLDWRCNVTAAEAFITENKTTPPGVNWSTLVEVGVRRT